MCVCVLVIVQTMWDKRCATHHLSFPLHQARSDPTLSATHLTEGSMPGKAQTLLLMLKHAMHAEESCTAPQTCVMRYAITDIQNSMCWHHVLAPCAGSHDVLAPCAGTIYKTASCYIQNSMCWHHVLAAGQSHLPLSKTMPEHVLAAGQWCRSSCRPKSDIEAKSNSGHLAGPVTIKHSFIGRARRRIAWICNATKPGVRHHRLCLLLNPGLGPQRVLNFIIHVVRHSIIVAGFAPDDHTCGGGAQRLVAERALEVPSIRGPIAA